MIRVSPDGTIRSPEYPAQAASVAGDPGLLHAVRAGSDEVPRAVENDVARPIDVRLLTAYPSRSSVFAAPAQRDRRCVCRLDVRGFRRLRLTKW
jgi:hypothetical protein